VTLSQLITVAGVLNKSYRSQVSMVSDNGSSTVRSSKGCPEQYCFEVVPERVHAFSDGVNQSEV